MGKLTGFDEQDQGRIKAIMCQIVEGRIALGEIESNDESIKAAMPQAMEAAKAAVAAANEYLCG